MHAGGAEQARKVGLWLSYDDAAVIVDRLPGHAAYPPERGSGRMFTLGPGQIGRYRANFRLTGCQCDPSWYYEEWVVHVSTGASAPDRFLHGVPDRDLDERVHLYGGSTGRRR